MGHGLRERNGIHSREASGGFGGRLENAPQVAGYASGAGFIPASERCAWNPATRRSLEATDCERAGFTPAKRAGVWGVWRNTPQLDEGQ